MIEGKSIIQEIKDRGFFYQCTDEEGLISSLNLDKSPSAYIGFDCTASSLHIGSLIQIMLLRMLQRHGIKPIVLIGGATTKIGDPTFKDKARSMLGEEQVVKNSVGIKESLSKFIKFGDGHTDAIMLNNDAWLGNLNYIDFLRDYGKHFSVNRMIALDSIKMRLEREQNLSFLEFNYMIFQAYDFLYLYNNNNCILQCGGSDQWGNIINGVDLIRRINGADAFGLTTPLVTNANGTKMGKTEKGAVWLNESMASPYEYYQFWRNIDDSDVFKFMKLFTDLPLEKISDFEQDKNININELKKILALEATKICHGNKKANDSHDAAVAAFEKGDMQNIDCITIHKDKFSQDVFLYELFRLSGLCSSNSEGRRLIKSGGAKLNQEKITDETFKFNFKSFKRDYLILSSGKKRHIKILIS